MNTLRTHCGLIQGIAATLLACAALPAFAAGSALQPASPSAFQQAQPTFGEQPKATPQKAIAPARLESFGLKAAPSEHLQAGTPAKGAVAPKNGVAQRAGRLFDMEDRAIIIVSGRSTTAGEFKRAIRAELAAKAGPPKTIKGGARKLDLAALDATSASAKVASLRTPRVLTTQSQSISLPGPRTLVGTTAVATSNSAAAIKDLVCADKGPPKLIEVVGRLKPGRKFSVVGRCLGARSGRVEIIGQFPGGRLVVPFTAWDMTGVELEMPANIRGASDHVVALSVVTAEGRATPAMQANFVAARERIEVPDRLWSPTPGFELASTVETLNTANGTNKVNPAASGQIAKSLRVNPQCALDNMDALVLSGGVSQIRGWELGPPNEAAVTIDWVGTCVSSTTTTTYHYVIAQVGDDVSVSSACRVAFQARAWAYCPAGVTP